MRYPVIIHKDATSDFGISVPDFPGVFTGGASLDEALRNVQEALETALDSDDVATLPEPSSLEHVHALDIAEGGTLALVDVNFDFLERKTVPVNITMPLYVRNRIDRAAKASSMTRSAFLVASALERARAHM